MDTLQETAIAIKEEWDIELPETISEETILKKIAERVVELIEQGAESFMQLMYRLDISEKKLHGVMHEADVADKIAVLIYERQLQKIKSREQYKSQVKDVDPDLKW